MEESLTSVQGYPNLLQNNEYFVYETEKNMICGSESRRKTNWGANQIPRGG